MEPKPHHQKEEPTWHYSGPLGPWGWPITLYHHVLLPTIYIVDSKAVLGRFIQRWLGEMTWIDDVAIPCPVLLLESLPLTPPIFLGRYSTSSPYIAALPPPSSDPQIPKTLIHILLMRIRASYKEKISLP